jgi:hypothetical protein
MKQSKMCAKRLLSHSELEAHFDEQLAFLEVSTASFDNGFEGEAKRLAVTLRVLFHETRRSKSLLKMLGKINEQFLDTALPANPASLLSHGGLVSIAMGSPKTRYVAMLDEVPLQKWVSFAEWWENRPVFVDSNRRELTRRQLVLTAANQDGGAHVDPALDEVMLSSETTRRTAPYVNKILRGATPGDLPVEMAMRYELIINLKTARELGVTFPPAILSSANQVIQ